MVHSSNIYYSKVYQKGKWKENIQFPPEQQKNQTSQTLRHSLDISDIGTQLNSLKIKLIQKWFIDLILNSKQGLAFFRQKQILRYNWHKYLPKHNNEGFIIQLLNVRLHFTNNKYPAPITIEEIFHQPIHVNPYTKLHFSSSNLCFYCIPSKNISGNYN